jgi:CBS domain-containing protein
MKIREMMTKNVQSIWPDASIQEAAKIMDEIDSGALPVCDGDRLVGIVTDRDIVIRSTSAGQSPTQTRVRDVMTSPISYCFDDQSVEEAGQIMKSQQIRRLAILDRGKRLKGILSLGDLAIESRNDQLTANVTRSVSSDEPSADMTPRSLEIQGSMRVGVAFAGVALGFGLMYFLDPRLGKRRRALLRDKGIHYWKIVNHSTFKKLRHLNNKAHGLFAESRHSVHDLRMKVMSGMSMDHPMVSNQKDDASTGMMEQRKVA